MKPTDKQVKEFWERFGFNFSHKAENHNFFHGATGTYADFYLYPDGDCGSLPPIDLNNLFKYAVPKLDQSRYYKALSSIFLKENANATTLFWAIYEVMK